MLIGVPKETAAGEKRVATVPDVVEKLVKLGFTVAVQSGAGDAANFADDTYRAAGAEVLVLREVPTQQEFVPVALARAVIDGQAVSRVATTLAKHVARSGPADSIVSRSVTPDRLMDPAAVLCSAGRCPASLDGQSL